MPKFYYIAQLKQRKNMIYVHSEQCVSLPLRGSRQFLGTFYHERDAVKISRMRYPGANPCPECFDNPRKYQRGI